MGLDPREPLETASRTAHKQQMNQLLHVDAARTVVVTVDMQRNYLDREVAIRPLAAADAERLLTYGRKVLDRARSLGIPVIHAYVSRRPAEVKSGFDVSPAKKLKDQQEGRTINDRLEGSPQAQIPAALLGPDDVHVTTKKSMDAFLDTDLDVLLRRVYGADTVVIMGINTDTCVLSTVFSASNRGYKPIVVAECVASWRGKDQHRMALELMAGSFVWVLTAEELMSKLSITSPTAVAR